MEITISKAFKIKKRITQKISQLEKIIESENSIALISLKDGPPELLRPRGHDLEKCLSKLLYLKKILIELKLLIWDNTRDSREKLLQQSEKKSYIAFMKKLQDKLEPSMYFVDEKLTRQNYDMFLPEGIIETTIMVSESEIDRLQDEIDANNAKIVITFNFDEKMLTELWL